MIALLVLAAGCSFDTSGISRADDARVDIELVDINLQDGGFDIADLGEQGVPKDLGDGGPVDLQSDAGDAGPPLTTLTAEDGRLWLGQSGAAPLRLLTWADSSGAWVDEVNLPAINGKPLWIVSRRLGAGQELAAITTDFKKKTYLELALWTGSAWSQVSQTIGKGAAHAKKRGADLAIERVSGDQLLVYTNGTKRPMFRVRSTSWSAATGVPINDGVTDLTSGIVLWVELVERAGSDQVALLYADASDNLGVVVWDGAKWVTSTARELTDELKTNTKADMVVSRTFDGAFETKSGDLIVAWGEDDFAFHYAVLPSGGSWTSEKSNNIYQGKVEFVDLEADPAAGSDDVVGVFADLGGDERLGLGIWNGSSWTAGELDDMRDIDDKATGDFAAAVSWIGTTGRAACVYSGKGKGNIFWAEYNGSKWSLGGKIAAAGMGETESVVLRNFSSKDKLMAIVSDDKSQVFAAVYTGGAWTVTHGGKAVTTTLSADDTRPFAFMSR